MKKADFDGYLKEEIHQAAQRISAKLSKSDRVDAGRLATLIAIRNVLAGSASPEDLGVNGAINDVLQTLGLIDNANTLLSGLEA